VTRVSRRPADPRRPAGALNWQDLLYGMDLEEMNSSVTPLAAPVQANRPFPWGNADAPRALDIIKGSYLLNLDQVSKTGVPVRIIQDPESLRAMSQRDAAAWEAWNQLDRDLLIQLNYRALRYRALRYRALASPAMSRTVRQRTPGSPPTGNGAATTSSTPAAA
jgi:hypothetical protein